MTILYILITILITVTILLVFINRLKLRLFFSSVSDRVYVNYHIVKDAKYKILKRIPFMLFLSFCLFMLRAYLTGINYFVIMILSFIISSAFWFIYNNPNLFKISSFSKAALLKRLKKNVENRLKTENIIMTLLARVILGVSGWYAYNNIDLITPWDVLIFISFMVIYGVIVKYIIESIYKYLKNYLKKILFA